MSTQWEPLAIKSKKEASQLGYIPERQLGKYHRQSSRGPMVPKIGESPLIVKGEAFYLQTQCERLLSKTEAQRMGLKLPEGANPLSHRNAHFGKSVKYALYRESDFN